MRSRNKLARASRCLVFAVALTAFGCPGDDEIGLYCSLMSLVAGPGFDFDACYDYDPGEFAEYRAYFDDVRAYQGLLSRNSISGPAAPSFEVFMTARYPDWATRAEALRAGVGASTVDAAPSTIDR